jgi:excisionase family DNA binding protein
MPIKEQNEPRKTDMIMTIDELAEYLKLGRRSLYRLAQSGELPGRKIVNRWRFLRSEIDEWIRSKNNN